MEIDAAMSNDWDRRQDKITCLLIGPSETCGKIDLLRNFKMYHGVAAGFASSDSEAFTFHVRERTIAGMRDLCAAAHYFGCHSQISEEAQPSFTE